jgi:hypothetical protein
LETNLASGDARQILTLLFLAAVAKQNTHCVLLCMALAGDTPGSIDFFQDNRGSAQRQSGATVFLKDQGTKNLASVSSLMKSLG